MTGCIWKTPAVCVVVRLHNSCTASSMFSWPPNGLKAENQSTVLPDAGKRGLYVVLMIFSIHTSIVSFVYHWADFTMKLMKDDRSAHPQQRCPCPGEVAVTASQQRRSTRTNFPLEHLRRGVTQVVWASRSSDSVMQWFSRKWL